MFYLATQILGLLIVTAAVFGGLGYVFAKKFGRARVSVSTQPPADPPPSRHHEEHDKVIHDLRTRLLEKERDLAQLLESVKPQDDGAVVALEEEQARYTELESKHRQLEKDHSDLLKVCQEQVERAVQLEHKSTDLNEEAESLRRQIDSLKAAVKSAQEDLDAQKQEVESARQEASDMRKALIAAEEELFTAKKQLETAAAAPALIDRSEEEALHRRVDALQKEVEEKDAKIADLLMAAQDPADGVAPEDEDEPGNTTVIANLANDEVNALRAELANKVNEISGLQGRIDSLQSQLMERDYLLQMNRRKQEEERESLVKAVDAIWADSAEAAEEDEIELEVVAGVSSRIEELERNNENVEKEFRRKIEQLESTVQSMRSDNEQALMAALESVETVKNQDPAPLIPLWNATEKPVEAEHRDLMVEELWKAERDAEKERLRRSVEDLKHDLDAKEKAIEEMSHQLEALSSKVDPEMLGPDNLQMIKGIGPYIKKMLEKEFNIKTFEQVASLTEDEIATISARLFFRDKIQRENWIGQARELHFKKYNEYPVIKNAFPAIKISR